MARKDDILQSFLEHDILKSKYKIDADKMPNNIREALKSDVPIVKAIALIVDNLEATQVTPDKELRNLILQHLNQTAI